MSEEIVQATPVTQDQEITIDVLLKDPKYQAIKSQFDKKVSDGINTYKSGSFQTEVEKKAAEIAEKLVLERDEKKKVKTPIEIQLEEMQKTNRELAEKFAQKEKNETINKLKADAIKDLAQAQLPLELVDFVITDDDEKSKENTELLKKVFLEFAQKIKQQGWTENNGSIPPSKQTTSGVGIKEPPEGAGEQAWKDYWKAVRELK